MSDLFTPPPKAVQLLDLAIDMRRLQLAFYAAKRGHLAPNRDSRDLLKRAKVAEARFDRAAVAYLAAEQDGK